MSDLSGRVSLVTGGSRGIGRAIVEALAKAGSRVAVVATREEGAEAAAAAARELGVEAVGYAADVRDPERAQEVVKDVVEKWGSLDVLVNNAGVTRDGLLLRMSPEDLDAVVDINLKGAFHYARAVARPMTKGRWGRIVNISSIVGITGNAGQANYAAAKAGLFGMTRSLAAEFGPRGVTVNAIAPGFIETDMTADLPEALRQGSLERIPAGRFGSGADIAAGVLFLVSESASYVTGTTLVVDGGMSL